MANIFLGRTFFEKLLPYVQYLVLLISSADINMETNLLTHRFSAISKTILFLFFNYIYTCIVLIQYLVTEQLTIVRHYIHQYY